MSSSFHIVSDTYRNNKKFKCARRSVCFKLNDIPEDVVDPEKWLQDVMRAVLTHVSQDIDPEDRVGLTFGSECFGKGDAYMAFKKARDITFEHVWELVGKLNQSNYLNQHTDTLRMTATIVKPYRGAGRVKNYTTFEEECNKRRGVVAINNTDNLCLVRALVVATAYATKSPFTEQIRRNRGKLQDIETQKLLQMSGLQIPEAGATMAEVREVQRHLKDYKITVYAYGSKGRTVLFEGPDAPHKLNLLHHDDHFNVITNLTGAFVCRYYCESCHEPYNNKNDHRCAAYCPCCQQTPPCEKTREEITCADCNRKFRGQECYRKHKAPGSYGKTTVCQHVKRCPDCLKPIMAKRQHTCDEVFCKLCHKYQSAGHQCFIQLDRRTPKTSDFLFVFYDLESRQDERGPNGERVHEPNLCVFQQRCDACLNLDITVTVCNRCCVRRQVLTKNPIETFVNFLLGVQKAFKKVVVIAHNGKGYDHQFLLKHVLENTDLKVDLIMRGTSIIMMGINHIKFIDSINYFPMALSALPKAFELGSELKKGYFPHYFNTLANAEYDGPLPGIENYDPDHMKDDARVAFLKWYEQQKDDNFNMQKDLVDYCVSDVDILTKTCLKFRKMFIDECNVCPFSEAVTIASACNLVYRRNFLKPQTIGIIPRNGYRSIDNQSRIATLWLIYEETQRGINILHSAKQREVTLDGAKVDGFCEQTNQIFEFYGCYYHGHTCLASRRDDPLHDDPSDTLNVRLERTMAKTARLRQRGYEVIEMWECEFRALLKNNKDLNKNLENSPLLSAVPINPRDAFFGGRTGNCKTSYQVKPGEKVKYVDVCSLYPWVCKYGKFPVGHPKVHVGDACKSLNLKDTDGLIKCKILPPQQLYHPVLPTRMNEKLMFVLCRTCGLSLNKEGCYHNEEQRALTGTWVIDEVQKAVEKGYKIMEVFEVWQYEIERYNINGKTGGLFTKMIDKFLKMKQQASGWPGSCTTDEEKNAYIEEFFEKEGIQMDFSEVVKNPGLRSLAKLMLNSFWGKFGQRENQPKTSIIRQPHELEELLSNPAVHVNNIQEVNKGTMAVAWEHLDDAADSLATVNVCIAAYTTAQARLKLYSYLEKLEERVLYYDTDSVIYVSRPGEWDVPTGSSLGEMTDELEDFGAGSYIAIFVSGGPKNYSYIVFSPSHQTYYPVCKVKGFCLNFGVGKVINFHSMSEMLETFEPIYVTSNNIRRTKEHIVITKEETKIYRPCLEKRRFQGHDSEPYGYKRQKLE